MVGSSNRISISISIRCSSGSSSSSSEKCEQLYICTLKSSIHMFSNCTCINIDSLFYLKLLVLGLILLVHKKACFLATLFLLR